MKIKTSELSGMALLWAVNKATPSILNDQKAFRLRPDQFIKDWDHGKYDSALSWTGIGRLIEREGIDLLKDGSKWTALKTASADHPHLRLSGPDPRSAVMRCFVASKLGDEVDVPDELMTETL